MTKKKDGESEPSAKGTSHWITESIYTARNLEVHLHWPLLIHLSVPTDAYICLRKRNLVAVSNLKRTFKFQRIPTTSLEIKFALPLFYLCSRFSFFFLQFFKLLVACSSHGQLTREAKEAWALGPHKMLKIRGPKILGPLYIYMTKDKFRLSLFYIN